MASAIDTTVWRWVTLQLTTTEHPLRKIAPWDFLRVRDSYTLFVDTFELAMLSALDEFRPFSKEGL